MSDKDLSAAEVAKEHKKVLKQSTKTLQDIEHALEGIQSTQHGVKALADSLGVSFERFNQLSPKDLERTELSLEEREDSIKAVNKFFEACENPDQKKPKHKKKSSKDKDLV